MARPRLGASVRLLAGFAISAIVIAVILQFVDGNALASALASVDPRFVVAAVGLYFLALWLRAVRFRVMVPQIQSRASFETLAVGFAVNNLLPFRLGEVARAYLLARWSRVPYGTAAAGMVIERILDGIALAVILAAATAAAAAAPAYIAVIAGSALLAFGGVGVLLAASTWKPSLIRGIVRFGTRPLPERIATAVRDGVEASLGTIGLLRSPATLARLAVVSAGVWVVELGMFAVMLPAFHLPLSLPLAYLTGAASNFATLMPSSPGYIGTFHGAVVKLLGDAAGISVDTAFAYALIVHATLFIPVVIVGLAIIWHRQIPLRRLTQGSVRLANEPATPSPSL